MNVIVRLDRLVGREVYTQNNRRLGRLEEVRVERHGNKWIVTEFIIGAAGLMERLGLGTRLVLGLKRPSGYAAQWSQIDLSNPDHPKLTCPVSQLRRE